MNWEMAYAREDIPTRVLVGRPDMDEPIVLDDEEAQDIYGVETVDLTDLETSFDVEMTQIANRILVVLGHTTAPRIAGVTLNAATAPDIADLLSTADPRTPSRFRCRHVSGNGRQVFSRMMFCTAIRHTISPTCGRPACPWMTPCRGRSAAKPDSGSPPKPSTPVTGKRRSGRRTSNHEE